MLDLSANPADLTAALVDVVSESGQEEHLADLVEAALRTLAVLSVERDGNVVIARTELGLPRRVLFAGHLDTVPVAGNVPSTREGNLLRGCGAADMKSGDAVALRVAYLVDSGAVTPASDLTWVFYDCEEVEAARNGLGRLARERPELLAGDLAILLEPTSGVVEGGCQGTMRIVVRTEGVRAHSARAWLGVNAIHGAAPILQRLAAYEARVVDVEGLTYREGLNAVAVSGGVAGNVIPDSCAVTVNYRFAPDRDIAGARAHLSEVFAGFEFEVVDSAPSARPGLDRPLARQMVASVGGQPQAKLGWTDVARFSELGIPAVNFGPGDPNVAHKIDEYVEVSLIEAAEAALVRFVSAVG